MSGTRIEGAVVRLQPIAREVAATLLAGRKPAGMAFAPGYPSPFSLEVMDLLAGPRAAEAGPGMRSWFVVLTDGELVVGEIGYGFDAQSATATLGYSIVEPSWGRGYATDALRALLGHLRDDPGEALTETSRREIRWIRAKTPVEHVASRRVMEKAGMALCDQRLEEVDGELVEVAVYDA